MRRNVKLLSPALGGEVGVVSLSAAAAMMGISQDSLSGFLDRDGYCIVDDPVLEARWTNLEEDQ